MSKKMLEQARAHILREEYADARDILRQLTHRSSTARRWLQHLDVMQPDNNTQLEPQSEQMEREPLNNDASLPPQDETPLEPEDLTPNEPLLPETDPDKPLDYAPIETTVTITDVEEMPIDETAELLPPEEDTIDLSGFTAMSASLPPMQWEYREIILETWPDHMKNIEAALADGGERIVIDDDYTHQLNQDGAQGWEVVSELVMERHIRLLMKRLRR